MALVMVDTDGAVTQEQVVEACRERLGSYKKPSVVSFTTEPLLRTPLGKVSRKLLREPYSAAGRTESVPPETLGGFGTADDKIYDVYTPLRISVRHLAACR